MAADGRVEIDTRINTSGIDDGVKEIGDKLKKAGDNMSSVGQKMTAGITAPIIGIGAAAFKMSNDLNEAMANVATLVPNNTKRIGELKQSVQDLAMQTGKSTSDIADGLYQVISTFGDTADTSKILADNVKAAAAGMATTTDAINLTAAVSKGYNDTSETTIKHITDLAFQTANLGITTFPELSKSIGGVTPLAATLGIKMEDMFAVFATGAGITGDTSQVATQFQNVLQALMAPTTSMSKLMKQLGYSNGEAMLKSLGLQGTINKIVDTAKKANVPLQNYIGSIDGQTLALALNGNLSKNFTDNLKAMGHVAGSTDSAFKQQTQGVNKLGFEWNQAKEKMQVFMQQLGDTLAPFFLQALNVMMPFTKKLQEITQWFSNLSPVGQKVVLALILIMAAIGPVILIVGKLITAIGAIAQVVGIVSAAIAEAGGMMAILGTVFAALTSPISLIIIGIVALGAALVWLYNHNATFAMQVILLWAHLQQYLNLAWQTIKSVAIAVWTNVSNFILLIWKRIVQFWNANSTAIKTLTMMAFNYIWNLIKSVMSIIVGIFQVAWPLISGIVRIAWDIIKAAISTALNLILGIVGAVLKVLTGDWKGAWDDIVTMCKNIGRDIVSAFKGINLLQIGKDIINGLINGIKSMAGGVVNAVKTVAGGIAGVAKNILQINSPSKVMMKIGSGVPEGMAKGIDLGADMVTKSTNKMSRKAVPVMPQSLVAQNKINMQQVIHQQSQLPDNMKATINIGGYEATGLVKFLTEQQTFVGNRKLQF